MKIMKLFSIFTAALVILVSTSAYADNRLLPADMLKPGQFFTQLTYSYTIGSGKWAVSIVEADVTTLAHTLALSLGFGIARDVECRNCNPVHCREQKRD